LATAGYTTLEQFAQGQLHIAYRDAILAQYSYRYDRKARRLKVVETPCIFKTSYASPQLEFWDLDDEQWRKIARRPYERHHPVPETGLYQLDLPIMTNPKTLPVM
jgi:hypothetical protein